MGIWHEGSFVLCALKCSVWCAQPLNSSMALIKCSLFSYEKNQLNWLWARSFAWAVKEKTGLPGSSCRTGWKRIDFLIVPCTYGPVSIARAQHCHHASCREEFTKQVLSTPLPVLSWSKASPKPHTKTFTWLRDMNPIRHFLQRNGEEKWGRNQIRLSMKDMAASVFYQQMPTTPYELELHLNFQWAYRTREPQLSLPSPGNMPQWANPARELMGIPADSVMPL